MTNEQLVNEARAEMFRKPTVRVLTTAEQIMERRMRVALYKREHEQIKRLIAGIAECNTRIASYGGSLIIVDVPAVFEDLPNKTSLDDLHRRLTVALSEGRSRLERLDAEALEKQWRQRLATESPMERQLRELREEQHELHAKIAALEAERPQPHQREIQPAREAPQMPFTTALNTLNPPGAYGFAPPVAPPLAARSTRGVAQRIQRVGNTDATPPRFAMPGVSDQIGEITMPHDFQAACLPVRNRPVREG